MGVAQLTRLKTIEARLVTQLKEVRAMIAFEKSRPAFTPAVLTERREQVLAGIREGLPNKLIADRLNISERTVKFHVSDLFRIFGVFSRHDL